MLDFEEQFPSLIGKEIGLFAARKNIIAGKEDYVGYDAIRRELIKKYCLDKQKVKKTIEKARNSRIWSSKYEENAVNQALDFLEAELF